MPEDSDNRNVKHLPSFGTHVGCTGRVFMTEGIAKAVWLECATCHSRSGDKGFEIEPAEWVKAIKYSSMGQ